MCIHHVIAHRILLLFLVPEVTERPVLLQETAERGVLPLSFPLLLEVIKGDTLRLSEGHVAFASFELTGAFDDALQSLVFSCHGAILLF